MGLKQIMNVTSIIRDTQNTSSIHRAVMSAGSSVFRSTVNVSGVYRDDRLPIPAIPELVAPLDLAVILSSQEFSWGAADYATEYQLQVATDETFDTMVVNETIGETSYNATGLTNAVHYWRVRGKRDELYSEWSTVQSVYVITIPSLTSPDNESFTADTTPEFHWSEVLYASSYDIEIATDINFTNVIEFGNADEYYLSDGLDNGTYYWRVRSVVGELATAWSSVWSVTVQSLTVPVLTSPTDASYTADTTPEFTWGAVSGATAYDILIARDSGFTDIVVSASPETNSYMPSALSNDVYYWKVRAKNLTGQTEYSSVWSVTVLTVPALTSPDDSSYTADTTPDFTWSAIEGASAYDIDIATDTGFANIVQTSSPATNSYTATALGNDVYYWRVRAKNGAVTTSYAAYRTVTVITVPILLSPETDEAVNITTQFDWEPVEGAANYDIQISLNSDYSSPLIDTTISDAGYEYNLCYGGITYYWRVRSKNGAIVSDWSGDYCHGVTYFKNITVTGTTAGAQTDYSIPITLHYGAGSDTATDIYLNGKCKSDFSDLVFRNSGGDVIQHYKWDMVPYDYCVVYFKADTIPASPDTVVFKMQYGTTLSDTSTDSAVGFADNGLTGVPTDKWDVLTGSGVVTPDTFIYDSDIQSSWYENSTYYHGPAGTFSMWNNPQAVYNADADRTYIVYPIPYYSSINIVSKFYYGITYYDHTIGRWYRPKTIGEISTTDAHANPALCVLRSGTIVVGYGGISSKIKTAVSDEPNNIGAFTAGADSTNNGVYPTLFEPSSGNLCLFYNSSPAQDYLYMQKSSDEASSWGSPTGIIFAGTGYWAYCKIYADPNTSPNKIHIFWTPYKTTVPTGRYNIYHVYSDDGGVSWKNSSGITQTLPVDTTKSTKVLDSGTDEVMISDIATDTNGNVYCLCSQGSGTTWQAKVIKVTSAGVVTTANVVSHDHQFDIGCIINRGGGNLSVYFPSVAVQANEDGGDIDEYRSSDSGASWAYYRHVTTGSTWSHNHIKPVYNNQPALRCIWSYGDSTPAATDKRSYLWWAGDSTTGDTIHYHKMIYMRYNGSNSSIIRAKSGSLQNAIVTAKIRGWVENPNNIWIGLRGQTSGNCYNGRAYHPTNIYYRLAFPTTYTSITTPAPVSSSSQTFNWGTWGLSVVGSSITFLFDGTPKASVTDTNITNAGYAMARVYDCALQMLDPLVRKYVNPEPTITAISAEWEE